MKAEGQNYENYYDGNSLYRSGRKLRAYRNAVRAIYGLTIALKFWESLPEGMSPPYSPFLSDFTAPCHEYRRQYDYRWRCNAADWEKRDRAFGAYCLAINLRFICPCFLLFVNSCRPLVKKMQLVSHTSCRFVIFFCFYLPTIILSCYEYNVLFSSAAHSCYRFLYSFCKRHHPDANGITSRVFTALT